MKEDGTLIIDYARGIIGRAGWGHMTPDNWGIICFTSRYDWYMGRQKDAEIADLTEEELKSYIAQLYDVEECSQRDWNRFFDISEDEGTIRTKNGEIIHGKIAELMLNEDGQWIEKPADKNHWYINPSSGDVEALLWDAGKERPDSVFTTASKIYAVVFYGSLILLVLLFFFSRSMCGIGKELAIRSILIFGSIAISTMFVTGGRLVMVKTSDLTDFLIAESLFLSITSILWHQIYRYRKSDKAI